MVDDVDAVYRLGIQAGGKSLREPADQVYGDRTGAVEDSFGTNGARHSHGRCYACRDRAPG